MIFELGESADVKAGRLATLALDDSSGLSVQRVEFCEFYICRKKRVGISVKRSKNRNSNKPF